MKRYFLLAAAIAAIVSSQSLAAKQLMLKSHVNGVCQVLIYGTKGIDTLGDAATTCDQAIVGYQASDVITAGLGHNTYIYTHVRDSRPNASDTIEGFDASKDVFDFTSICSTIACHFEGNDDGFDGTPGSISMSRGQAWRCDPDSTCGDFYFTEVLVDTDGDYAADMMIWLDGQIFLSTSNFKF